MTAPEPQPSALRDAGSREARIAVTGASGFLGAALVGELERSGATVHRMVRGEPRRPTDIPWDPDAGTVTPGALEGMDAVIHLAGEPIAQRWTSGRKRRIRDSRVHGTAAIARAIAGLARPPRVLLSGSAIGIYGSTRGDAIMVEGSAPGDDFLSTVGVEWERAAEPVRAAGVRLVFLRTGIVLGAEGGVLARLLPPFRMGVGGRLGSGQQWMSWIALQDWVAAVRFVLATESIAGPVNLVAPNPVTNDELTRTLAFVLHRSAIFPVPEFVLRALFDGMADAVLTGGQRVLPRVLESAGFRFHQPTLEPALEAILRG
jgi:uncharacterized protein